MRKTKSEGKTVGIFAISSQTVRKVLRISQCENPHCEFRNAKTTLRISQCEKPHCEFRNAKFRNAKNHIANFAMRKTTLRNSQCEISQCEFGNAKLVANLAANLAMRIFAKVLHFCVRQMNSVLWLQNIRNAKFAMRSWQTTFRNAKWLPTDCQLFAKIPVLLFLF